MKNLKLLPMIHLKQSKKCTYALEHGTCLLIPSGYELIQVHPFLLSGLQYMTWQCMTGPALGMFKMFGQTRPPISGGPPFKLQGGSRFDLSLDWLSVCHSLQCWPKNQKWMQPDVFCKHTMQQNATVAGNTPRRKRGEGERRLTPMCSWNREQGHWQTKAGPGVWQRQVLLNDHQTTTVAVTHNAKTRAVDIND